MLKEIRCTNYKIYLLVYYFCRLTSQASELLFRKAKDRIYTLINTPPAKSPLNLTKKLRAVKECQPKWQLLSDIMKEIRAIYQQYASKLQDQKASKSKKSKVDKSSSSSIPTSSSNISADGSGDDGALNGRVLVYVKDERTAMHVRDILAFGLAYVMDQRHRWFVSQQAADIRPTKNQSTRPILSSTTLGTVDETTASVTSTVTETTTASSDYLGLGVSKTVFDKLSDENKLILFHVSTRYSLSLVKPYIYFHAESQPIKTVYNIL